MKDRNPFKLNIILWSIVLLYSFSMCIVSVYTHTHFGIVVNLCLTAFDSFWLGWSICKFREYNKFLDYVEDFEKIMAKKIQDMKNKEREPFKEFKIGNKDK